MAKDELRSDKVSPRYAGPFEILRRNRGGSYLLRGSDNTVYHRPACSLKLVARSPLIPLPSNHFEVEAILDHRPKTHVPQNNSEYFVNGNVMMHPTVLGFIRKTLVVLPSS
jgi:hypothetical protein